MKLKTSFSKFTTFRKDITRFAPLWVIYFVAGLLMMLTLCAAYYPGMTSRRLIEMLEAMGPINFVYASLAANLLFGDLFNSRMCNAIHAAPLRREHLFASHVAAGICFSLVPHVVAMLVMTFYLKQLWIVGFWWIMAATIEYLFFFGVAVLSCMCTGSRFAMVVVDGLINFCSMIAMWFCETVYIPLLYGVSLSEEMFVNLCPVVKLTGIQPGDIISIDQYKGWDYENVSFGGLGKGWGYLSILGVLGVLALAAALVLYRRRHLECAGDFVVFKPLEPVFLTVYTLCVGATFALVGQVFGGYEAYLVIGLIIGFFTGMMLLKRTIKVFTRKTLIGCLLFTVVGIGSLAVVSLDPVGIVDWMPKDKDVSSVTINFRGKNVYWKNQDPTCSEAMLEEMLQIHKEALEQKDLDYYKWTNLYVTYTLKNGKTVRRRYEVTDDFIRNHEHLFSRTEVVFNGYSEADLRKMLTRVVFYAEEAMMITGNDIGSLLDAIVKDCKEGTLNQDYIFHEQYDRVYNLDFFADKGAGGDDYLFNLTVFGDSQHTMAWIKEYKQNHPDLEGKVEWE